MDKRTPVQSHIFSHLFDFVERHPVFVKGEPYYPNSSFDGKLQKMYDNGWHFYIDKNGILKRPRDKTNPWKKKPEDDPNIIETKDPDLFYIRRKSDGVWFSARLKTPSGYDLSPHYYSLFLKERNPDWAVDIIKPYRISGKSIILKTLSKKEKKKLNI